MIYTILKDQSKPYDSKKNVWVPDAEEGYIAAEVKATKGDMVSLVTCRGNEVSILLREETIQKNINYFEELITVSSII